jgi:hypothetical protein
VASGAGARRCALAAATLDAKVSTESESLINPTAPAAAWRLEGSGRDAIPEPGAGEAWSKATKPSSVIIQDTASSSKVLNLGKGDLQFELDFAVAFNMDGLDLLVFGNSSTAAKRYHVISTSHFKLALKVSRTHAGAHAFSLHTRE